MRLQAWGGLLRADCRSCWDRRRLWRRPVRPRPARSLLQPPPLQGPLDPRLAGGAELFALRDPRKGPGTVPRGQVPSPLAAAKPQDAQHGRGWLSPRKRSEKTAEGQDGQWGAGRALWALHPQPRAGGRWGESSPARGAAPSSDAQSEVSRWRRRRAAGTGAHTRAGRPHVWNSAWSWLKCCVKAAAVSDAFVLAS